MLSNKTSELSKLAAPILLGQMGQMLIGAGDVFVAAKHSATMVAAIAISNAFCSFIFIFFLAFLFGMSPVLSKMRGQGDSGDTYLPTCLVYGLLISVVAMIGVWSFTLIVPYIGIEKQLIPMVQDYMFWFSWSFPTAFVYFAIREFLQARENVLFVNIIAMVAVFLNIALNFMLVFGFHFIPACGFRGLAFASILVRLFMMIAVLFHSRHHFQRPYKIFKTLAPDFIKLGFPTALAILTEMAAFCGSTLIIASIDTMQTAAHNIVLTFASITFMVPLSVAIAASIKIAHALGQKNELLLKQYMHAALTLSLGFMSLTAILFFTIPEHVLKIFTVDQNLIRIAVPILIIAALFQIFDGAQVTLSGILRGLHITRPAFFANLAGYWVFGLPIGCYLAFKYHLGATGIWIGLAIGLCLVALSLSVVLGVTIRKLKHLY